MDASSRHLVFLEQARSDPDLPPELTEPLDAWISFVRQRIEWLNANADTMEPRVIGRPRYVRSGSTCLTRNPLDEWLRSREYCHYRDSPSEPTEPANGLFIIRIGWFPKSKGD